MKKVTLVLILVSAISAFAAEKAQTKYKCSPAKENSNDGTYIVTITGDNAATIKDANDVQEKDHQLNRDKDYAPRYNKTYNRYLPQDDFGTGGESYAVEVLLNKNMLKDVKDSSMKIVARGEVFFNNYFSCEKQ